MKVFIRRTIILLLAVVFIIFLINFNNIKKVPLVNSSGQTFEKAVVVKVVKDNLGEDGNRYGNQKVKLKMLSGKLNGKIVDATSDSGYLFGAACKTGMHVIAISSVSGNTNVTSVYSIDRGKTIYIFIGIFILALCLVGGKKGIKSAIALILTFVLILFLYIPMIYKGYSPILAAVLLVIAISSITMYMIAGYSVKTASAIIGTLCGVALSGIFAAAFGYFAGISGTNVADVESLLFIEQMTKAKIGGLLFSGILISSLGAVMDIAMDIASALNELHVHNPSLERKKLFMAGINVGRDMAGTMSNTLILAFAGGSLGTILIDYAYNLPYHQVINSYLIGIQIMQGISGSLGAILTVPLVSLVASYLLPLQKLTD